MTLGSGIQKIEQVSMRSFKGCPYNCTDGYIINPYMHSRQECPYCAELRKKQVSGTVTTEVDLNTLLNLPESFTGSRFDTDMLWPKSELKLLSKESVDSVCKALIDLYRKATGVAPITHSIVINLGRHAHTNAFAYPFMIQAYKGSKSVAPYVSDYDVRLLFSDKPSTIEGLELATLLSSDICLVNILASATLDTILACKGLMQLRARSDKPTIFLTDYFGPGLVGLHSDEKSLDLAYMLSVEYVQQEKHGVIIDESSEYDNPAPPPAIEPRQVSDPIHRIERGRPVRASSSSMPSISAKEWERVISGK